MVDRINTSLEKLRLAKGDISDAEMKRRSNPSRQVFDDLKDKNLQSKDMLVSAFIKSFDGVKGVGDDLVSKIQNCASSKEADELLQLVELRTNGALLTTDGGLKIATSRQEEFGQVQVKKTDPLDIQRPYLAVPWKVQDIVAQRHQIDRAVYYWNLMHLSQPSEEYSAEREFLLKNLVLFASQTSWCSTNPEVVSNNAEPLQMLSRGLNTWAMEDSVADVSDDVDSLMKKSQEKVELQSLFNGDKFFEGFGFLYAPMVVTGRIDLCLETIDFDYYDQPESTHKYLHFELPVRRVIHCFVVTEPHKKLVIAHAPKIMS